MAERRATGATPSRLAAVCFDLDDTLFDSFTQCVGPAHREASVAMRTAGLRAPLEAIVALREAFAGRDVDVDRVVAEGFSCVDPERVAAAGRRAFFERDPGPVRAHSFTLEVLAAVRARAHCVLLTAGAPAAQRLKVERLGLAEAFHAVLYVDPSRGEDKRTALGAWMRASGLAPARVLVVGDRPQGEIAAAQALGCPALRIRAGECAREATPLGVHEGADVRAVLRFLPA